MANAAAAEYSGICRVDQLIDYFFWGQGPQILQVEYYYSSRVRMAIRMLFQLNIQGFAESIN